MMKRIFFGIAGMAAFFLAFGYADDHVFKSVCLFVVWAVCMQKAGVVDWKEEIGRED